MNDAARADSLLALCQGHPKTAERARILMRDHNDTMKRIAQSGQLPFAKEEWYAAARRTFCAMLVFNLQISEVDIPAELLNAEGDTSND